MPKHDPPVRGPAPLDSLYGRLADSHVGDRTQAHLSVSEHTHSGRSRPERNHSEFNHPELNHSEPGHPETDVGSKLALVLRRIDGLRDRPQLGSSVAVTCLVAASALWWIGRPADAPQVELAIPMADTVAEVSTTSTVNEIPEGTQPKAVSDSSGSAHAGSQPADPGAEQSLEVVVLHISGGVHRQGLVTLPSTARIADAVSAAGGPVEGADTHRLNLAARVTDGQHIRVPMVGDEDSGPLVEGGAPSHVADTHNRLADQPVNINSADQPRLESLPGVGPATAGAIIQWREENGLFATVDDLLLVSGIGPAKLASIRELVVTR